RGVGMSLDSPPRNDQIHRRLSMRSTEQQQPFRGGQRMTRTATNPKLMVLVVLAAALVAVFAAQSGTAMSTSRQLVVRTANNPTLHTKVLVNRRGLTLYS